MKVIDILEHFLSRADWVDRENTCDRVVAGNPEQEVDRCVVTWMPSCKALKHTLERGVTLLICHEPTFWNHLNDRPTDDSIAQVKLRYIQEHNLIVLRNHDCWDRWSGIGIPWAWAKFLSLGLNPVTIGGGYQHRYDIEPVSLGEFANKVAKRCKAIGEPMVQVTGELSQKVSKIGIGTGCGCGIDEYLKMGCDCSVVCDDGTRYWSGIQKAEDRNHPVIRVNHGTSEEPGMVTLTKYINRHIKDIAAEHLPHGSTFKLIGK